MTAGGRLSRNQCAAGRQGCGGGRGVSEAGPGLSRAGTSRLLGNRSPVRFRDKRHDREQRVTGHLLTMLIQRLGPAGVALGAGLEGETAVVLGGAAARHGLFNPVAAALAAFIGSFVADQLVFWASRHERDHPLVHKWCAKPAVGRALHFLERHPRLFCFGFRFVYGFRIAGPAAVGLSAVAGRTFIVLNALSAALWAGVFTWAGYRFGKALIDAIRPLLHIPHIGVELGIFALAVAFVAFIRLRK